MRIVGWTGGIASGKSIVSNLFKAHGIPVVNADIVAQNILKKGTGGWKKVVAAFGEDILLDNGEVDRAKLVLKLWIKGFSILVLDVPILFEANMDSGLNQLLSFGLILRHNCRGS
ncbi:hypothetical protein K7X08_000051 [Anisodus acutangulus]|uniref:Dephospho-CoA kinase n=1 Tax=Anisodus acutangulus TaxID=402998 RepID=A0A9Q1M5Z0_9SOLA|nr:hypothetical protein K7X08_000051 [Anisodus acutangulus]